MSTTQHPVPEPLRPPLPSAKRMGTFGMFLFLASLAMLFLASMLAYALTRVELYQPTASRSQFLPFGDIHLPPVLWLSTFLIVVSSATLHYAGLSISLERQRAFRNAMLATCLLALAFLFVQTPALLSLIQQQRSLVQTDIRFYFIIFILIVLHALHVLGGIVPLALTTRRAFAGRYDRESHHAITCLALYWHFLDVIWLLMFSMLQLLQ